MQLWLAVSFPFSKHNLHISYAPPHKLMFLLTRVGHKLNNLDCQACLLEVFGTVWNQTFAPGAIDNVVTVSCHAIAGRICRWQGGQSKNALAGPDLTSFLLKRISVYHNVSIYHHLPSDLFNLIVCLSTYLFSCVYILAVCLLIHSFIH